MTFVSTYASPFGNLALFATDIGLCGVGFLDDLLNLPDPVTKECILNPQAFPEDDVVRDDDPFTEIKSELDSYFKREIEAFSIPIDFSAKGTAWQQQVWQALCEVPYGQVMTYGELAAHIGNPRAARAVGLANNRNPIAIVVPCHRIIGANGALVGYAGGLSFKRALLDLEGADVPSDSPATTRDALLQAAAREFAWHGYEAANVQAIANNAGVNKRMIYHHFGSKSSLYEEAWTQLEVLDVEPEIVFRLKLNRLLQEDAEIPEEIRQDLRKYERRVASAQASGDISSSYDPVLLAKFQYLADAVESPTKREQPQAKDVAESTRLVGQPKVRTRTRIDPVIKRIENP